MSSVGCEEGISEADVGCGGDDGCSSSGTRSSWTSSGSRSAVSASSSGGVSCATCTGDSSFISKFEMAFSNESTCSDGVGCDCIAEGSVGEVVGSVFRTC